MPLQTLFPLDRSPVSASDANTRRLAWVDLAKGICIFAVVVLYAVEMMRRQFGDAGWLSQVSDFAKPFRMPDFFLISGLFLARVINRPWASYLDKKVLHYAYFFVLWTVVNVGIEWAVQGADGGAVRLIRSLWSNLSSWPFHMLWFIQMLPAYFLFTKLTRRVPAWAMFAIAAGLQAFPPPEVNRTIIDEFWVRYVYFYAGYAFAPLFFSLAEKVAASPARAIGALLLWAAANEILVNTGLAPMPGIALALGLAGAGAVITVAALLADAGRAEWLRYMGEHSIVVYLAFYWPMMLMRIALVAIGWPADRGLFGLIITLAGIAGAFALYEATRRSRTTRWLFARPRWAHLPGQAGTRPSAA